MPGSHPENPHKRDARPEFWQLSMRCCQLAGGVDVAFFFIFLILGSPVLAWVNVISVAMYVYAYRAFSQRRNRLAIMLIRTEVLVHAGLGTVLVGWESGFHYFLLMFIPALFVSMRARSAWILAVCLWLYYVGLDVLMWYIEPLQPISSGALLGVHVFNLTIVFCMFSYLALFYVVTVTRAHRRLARMATTDPLTGLFNRRHIIELTEKELARHHRRPSNLTFMLMDIDHFKQINDQFGHDMGDRALVAVSKALQGALREQDFIGRWGGEEFLVILPDTDLEQATASAERLRSAIESLELEQDGERVSVTLSIGITQYRAEELLSSAVARADHALYAGKSAGRNRVEIALA
ncbi:diguanylate cyclase [Pseudomonas neustonica]|uniref:diguanylate cyclase n=2 Tax=Pseudomonas TaxID=286 RepID=A0ABX9XJ88_9PSED|nr:diguanylate cyclase [Pseudomonas sp. 5Ae-yellow]ROZ83150.1 diguanylate cyclase [Pseudomonas neustonica]ROZ86822.1 diguanylate cyclase [Pseudomonas sp. SSM44]|tara:strand:+ start:8048 stop:9100 length:1053 start_codon:yes stop_codon:yes gene_type:complete